MRSADECCRHQCKFRINNRIKLLFRGNKVRCLNLYGSEEFPRRPPTRKITLALTNGDTSTMLNFFGYQDSGTERLLELSLFFPDFRTFPFLSWLPNFPLRWSIRMKKTQRIPAKMRTALLQLEHRCRTQFTISYSKRCCGETAIRTKLGTTSTTSPIGFLSWTLTD